MIHDLSWQADAACHGLPDTLFYSPDNRGGMFDYEAGLRICRGCPVQTQCLDYALEMESADANALSYGLWGGMRPKDRAAILANGERAVRQRRRQAAADAETWRRINSMRAEGLQAVEAAARLGMTQQDYTSLYQRIRRGNTCKQGHERTPENTGTKGRCMQCAREYDARKRRGVA